MRRFLVAATCALLLAACGSRTETAAPQSQASGAPTAAFPVTMEHKYGSTTITAEPKRIVLVGLTEQDALLALGIVPVGTTEWLGKYEGAIAPWAKDKLNGAPLPTVLDDKSGVQFEKVASLRPDLIIGIASGIDQEAYNKLTKIAPTVAQAKGYTDYGIPWQETTKLVGKAVGKSAQAEQLVAGAEAELAKVRTDNPRFGTSTGLVATSWEGYFVYGVQDPRSRFLASLGFKMPARLQEVIGDKFGASISKEQVDLLDQNVLVWLAQKPADARAELDKDPLYTGLKVAKEKRDVIIDENTDYGSAMSFISVLSIPFLLDNLVPQLVTAAK
ncbi:MAG: iron-siderophore ABC transporter substrate-binding protein [Kibdelosporangium sp.]